MSFDVYLYPEKSRVLQKNDSDEDIGISESIEKLYSNNDSYLYIDWNGVIMKLPIRSSFSQIFNQIIYEIPHILKFSERKMRTSVLDSEFTVILDILFDKDQMIISPTWVETPLSQLEQKKLDAKSELKVGRHEFSLKWKKVFDLIIKDLKESGYGSLEDFQDCEKVVKEINSLI